VRLFDAARRAASAGDFRRGREIYRQILAEQPEQETALRELAGLEAQATAEVQRELAEAARDLAGHDTRGAIARYRKALDIDPANEKALRGLEAGRARLREELSRLVARGNSALEKGELPGAEAGFREALAIDPYQSEARAGLRRIEQLRKSGAQPGDEKELYLRGIELYTRGRYEEAVGVWEQVLVLAPGHEKARMNIDKARRKLRQIQEYRGG
jgi:tetratricopeptide (TPR) repeat protein